VGGDEVTPQPGQEPKPFVPTPESKSKATRLRVFAGILWVLAIAAQVVAISMLFKQPINMTWIIILIGIDLALAIVGSLLWKKSNRFDPASEKNKFLFFMQSQLGDTSAKGKKTSTKDVGDLVGKLGGLLGKK
jgi:hypothetical protein